jgi:hypothetical protein
MAYRKDLRPDFVVEIFMLCLTKNVNIPKWVGHVPHVGVMRNAYKILVREQGKRPLRRPRHRWEDNTKVDLMEIGWEVVD